VGNLYDEALVVLHGIWRRRWLALAVGWGIALLGWLVVSLIPNTYKSEAKIYVQSQSLLPDKIGITPNQQKAGIETVRQTLTSVENLQKVVRGTDLAKQMTSDRDVTDKAVSLQKQITITSKLDNLFEISATASEGSLSDAQNAKLSKAIVQKLIDLFVDGNLRDGRQETGQSLTFLDQQVQQRAAQLAEVEAKRAAFEAKYLNSLPGTGSLDDRVAQARGEMARVDSDLAAANSALAAVNGQLAATPAETRTPGSMVGGDSRVAQILGQISDGQARGWTDNHPDMIALRGQLARARAQGGGGAGMSAGSASPNPMYVSLRSMQAEKQATASALAARKAQLQGEINRVLTMQSSDPEFANAQAELDRNYTALKAQYDKLLADREDVRLRGQVQTQTDAIKFSVIDPPSAPRAPAAPNRPLLLTLVLFAAIGGGIGAAFAFGQLKTTYSTASRLERASGLPVIGSITEVIRASEREFRKKRMRQFAGGAGALVGVWALLMVVEFVQRSMVA
jgi:polysaccharide chain length determinant protein (PEP-CTERM system associated)